MAHSQGGPAVTEITGLLGIEDWFAGMGQAPRVPVRTMFTGWPTNPAITAHTGVRLGDAIALRVADVELLRRRISVSENAVQLGVPHAVGATKGRKARSVPVPEFVLDELSRQCKGKAPADLVFAGRDGGYLLRPKSSTGRFQAAVKRAGVQKVTPHDPRHTCASLAVSAG